MENLNLLLKQIEFGHKDLRLIKKFFKVTNRILSECSRKLLNNLKILRFGDVLSDIQFIRISNVSRIEDFIMSITDFNSKMLGIYSEMKAFGNQLKDIEKANDMELSHLSSILKKHKNDLTTFLKNEDFSNFSKSTITTITQIKNIIQNSFSEFHTSIQALGSTFLLHLEKYKGEDVKMKKITNISTKLNSIDQRVFHTENSDKIIPGNSSNNKQCCSYSNKTKINRLIREDNHRQNSENSDSKLVFVNQGDSKSLSKYFNIGNENPEKYSTSKHNNMQQIKKKLNYFENHSRSNSMLAYNENNFVAYISPMKGLENKNEPKRTTLTLSNIEKKKEPITRYIDSKSKTEIKNKMNIN